MTRCVMVIQLNKPIQTETRDLDIHEGTLDKWVDLWHQGNGEVDLPLDANNAV
ncbi:MAG: hypothetical protein Q4D73_01435 [Actinomycetaceae bacterium]|nr:hypothetical protein [Actinomycetaceae bacterium]